MSLRITTVLCLLSSVLWLAACATPAPAPVVPPPLRADVATARAHPQARLVARDYPDFYRTVLTLLARANARENQPAP